MLGVQGIPHVLWSRSCGDHAGQMLGQQRQHALDHAQPLLPLLPCLQPTKNNAVYLRRARGGCYSFACSNTRELQFCMQQHERVTVLHAETH